MARLKSAMKFAGFLEVESAAPLDSRLVCETKADLTSPTEYPYTYEGMNVYVKSEKQFYTLVDEDATNPANWVKASSTGTSVKQIDVDAVISDLSENPVQNKAISSAITTINTAIQNLETRMSSIKAIDIDNAFDISSENPVQNKVVSSAITTIEQAIANLKPINVVSINFPAGYNANQPAIIDSGLTAKDLKDLYAEYPEKQIYVKAAGNIVVSKVRVNDVYVRMNYISEQPTNWCGSTSIHRYSEDNEGNGKRNYFGTLAIGLTALMQDMDFATGTFPDTAKIYAYALADTTDAMMYNNFSKVMKDADPMLDSFKEVQETIDGLLSMMAMGDVVDDALDETSYNPVTNRVVTSSLTTINTAIQNLEQRLSSIKQVDVDDAFDVTSVNPLQNGIISSAITTINTAISNLEARLSSIKQIDVDIALDDTSENPVQNKVISSAITTIQQALQNAGLGDGKTVADINVSNAIGRYNNGDKIDAGTGFETIFKNLLEKVYTPVITPPSLSVNWNAPALAKVGSNITGISITFNYNRGKIEPAYGTNGFRAGEATGYSLLDGDGSTGRVLYNGEEPNTSISSISSNVKVTKTYTCSVSYAAGEQPKDSDGNNFDSALDAGTLQVTKSVKFILPFIKGVTTNPNVSDFTGMVEDLTEKSGKEYRYTSYSQYLVFAYDAAYGDLKSIKDQNGFEGISGWNKTVQTIDGQSYNVYVTQTPSTDTDAKYTFAF